MELSELNIPKVEAKTFYKVDLDSFDIEEVELFQLNYDIYDTELNEVDGDGEYLNSEEEAQEWLAEEVPRLYIEAKKQIANYENTTIPGLRREIRLLTAENEKLRAENASMQITIAVTGVADLLDAFVSSSLIGDEEYDSFHSSYTKAYDAGQVDFAKKQKVKLTQDLEWAQRKLAEATKAYEKMKEEEANETK